jgi:hypothetical protein
MMKMKIKKIISVVALSLLSTQLFAAPVIYLDFDGDGLQDTTYNAVLGDTITASLYVTNVDNVQGGLLGWGAEFNFDNTSLQVASYAIDNVWGIPGRGNVADNLTGKIELLATTFVAQTGTLKLVDINFNTIGEGTSSLVLSELFPDLINFTGFGGANGYDYDADIMFGNANASITVSAVPLPASVILFASGLIGLSGFRRSKK